MAKKTDQSGGSSGSRQSRKEELRAKKQEEQLRNVRIGVVIVGILLAAVLLFALVNEFVVGPQREVASVAGEKIALNEWQQWVKYERAQRIITLEDQLEAFNNDVGLVQQFSGQTINELQSYEGLGEATLNRMAQDKIIMQALAERGVEIGDDEIDERIAQAYNYFGGDSPPAQPEPAQTVAPTPSITPIPAEGSAPAVEAPPLEAVPTSEPPPTATPVSAAYFEERLSELLGRYRGFGVGEETYRSIVAGSIASERLLDLFAEEQGLPTEDEHASAFLIYMPSLKTAEDVQSDIAASDFLTVWNTLQSAPAAETEEAFPVTATEVLWLTQDTLANQISPEAAAAIFDTPVNEPSGIVETAGSDGTPVFLLVMPSGFETRPLSEAELQQRKIALLTDYIDGRFNEDVEIGEFWRNRVPEVPKLNPDFLQAPTPTPPLPDEAGSETTE